MRAQPTSGDCHHKYKLQAKHHGRKKKADTHLLIEQLADALPRVDEMAFLGVVLPLHEADAAGEIGHLLAKVLHHLN